MKTWLGYCKPRARDADADLVSQANTFADGVPPVERQIMGKTELKGVRRPNVVPDEPRAPRLGGGRGGGGGGEEWPMGRGGRSGGEGGGRAGGSAGGCR